MKNYKGYTGVNTTEKIKRDANRMLEKSLSNAIVSSNVLIAPNGEMDKQFETEVQIFQKWDSDGEAYKVIGRICDIERGNYIVHDGQVFLVVTKPEDNGTFRKAEAHLCSTTFPIKYEDRVEIIGKDDIGRPIKKTIKGEVVDYPCVPKMNDASTAIAETNKPVNLLANIVTVTIPYKEALSIQHDELFDLYGENYRIIRIDPSDSILGVGILRITGERIERADKK